MTIHHPDCPEHPDGWGIGWACDCPERTPEETPMTDPAPLTDDEVLEYARKWPYHENDLISVVISRLVATVEQTRRERDAAYACIRLLRDGYKPLGGWWNGADHDKPMSSAEIDAIRRAWADTPETSR